MDGKDIRPLLFNDVSHNVGNDSFEDGHYYLLVFVNSQEGFFSFMFVHWNNDVFHSTCVSLLKGKTATNHTLLMIDTLIKDYYIKCEISPDLFAKAERMAGLYRTAVRSLFRCAAAKIQDSSHLDVIPTPNTPYICKNILREDQLTCFVSSGLNFECVLEFQGQKMIYEAFICQIEENGMMWENFSVPKNIPDTLLNIKEMPRHIFLDILARHKSYCESILSLAIEYLCPPSTTFNIRHILTTIRYETKNNKS